MNYQFLSQILGNNDVKKLDRNLVLRKGKENSLDIVYHATTILSYTPTDQITIKCGGFATKAVLDKINKWLPAKKGYQIRQHQFVWYVTIGDKVVPFKEGMIVHS